VGHFGIFALLGVALAGVFATSQMARRSPRRSLIMLLLVLWIFAAITEIGQSYIDREASLADWGADMAGAVVGLLGGGVLLRLLLGGQLVEAVPPPELRNPPPMRERGPGGGRPRRRKRRR
jgi:VanZ family protein